MGVIYCVLPLDDDAEALLRNAEMAVPKFKGRARNPTPKEIRSVCQAMANVQTRVRARKGRFWQIDIKSTAGGKRAPATLLNIDDFSGNEDEAQEIWFEKGSPALMLEVVRGLAGKCGPLVVLPDTGDAPVVVTARDNVDELLDAWEHTRDGYED
jgi:hypothetical protein